MSIDETTLRAYVDGELTPAECRKVESAIAGDPELLEQVEALQASCLPYRLAFERQPLPDVPASLSRRLDSWIAMTREPSASAPPARRHWLRVGAALAASFAAGLWMPVPWRLNPDEFSEQPWVQAIARYQALYVRETVDLALNDVNRTRALLAAFSARQGVPVVVPDLRDAGMTFRHIQRLAFNDAPVIQMVYLPPTGRPLALCVVGANPSGGAVTTRRMEGLEVSTWGRHGLAYVMVADMPRDEATLLAERLASGRTPILYAS